MGIFAFSPVPLMPVGTYSTGRCSLRSAPVTPVLVFPAHPCDGLLPSARSRA